MFEELRKKGNFNHNIATLKEGKGSIVVEKDLVNHNDIPTIYHASTVWVFTITKN